MCGRYGLFHDGPEIADLFGADIARLDPPLTPRYNIAPTQLAPVLLPQDPHGRGEVERDEQGPGENAHRDAGRAFVSARWGLIPHWVKDPATFRATLVNARAESAHQKPSFRDALKRDRCVVPASGFYEWRAPEDGGRKQPYLIRRRDGAPMALAGLHARNDAAAPHDSFTILTTRPNALMARLHDRQPVILPLEAIPAWFDPARRDAASLSDLLEPCDPEAFEAVPIGTAINAPARDGPEVIAPAGEALRV
ncbi:MAG: SOS response-associated peptidase [Trueperaceae bacterium]|nr:SOS response-associated peptidase [Trueperaceae bacterium]